MAAYEERDTHISTYLRTTKAMRNDDVTFVRLMVSKDESDGVA